MKDTARHTESIGRQLQFSGNRFVQIGTAHAQRVQVGDVVAASLNKIHFKLI